MKIDSKKAGFTLVEMVVVLGIMGVVTAVVLMSLDTARSQSRDKARISDIKSIQLALEVYYSHNKHYPDTLNGLVDDGEFSDSTLPSDPQTHESYYYVSYNKTQAAGSEKCRSYHLGTILENNNQFFQDAEHFNSTDTNKTPVTCGYSGTDSAGFDASVANSLYYDVKSKY